MVTSDDSALIEEGFSHLSERSRFMRFLISRKALTQQELDRLTDPDDDDNVALGAITVPEGEPVGLARFARFTPGGAKAEIALTVVDTYQRQGAGRHLLRALAQVAGRCGVIRFVALVHRENHAMRALLTGYGGTERRETFTELRIELPVSAIAGA